jgi:transcriptional regulator with XRE-family HTH domain
MAVIGETLRQDLKHEEFSEGYAESFLDAYIATQIKVLREQNEMTQAQLAERLKTTQTAISRIENVNYSGWNISTLKRIARAFDVRLKVSFETYGSLIRDVEGFNRESLRRTPREKDTELLQENVPGAAMKKLGNVIDLAEYKQRMPEPERAAELIDPSGALSQTIPPGNKNAEPRIGVAHEGWANHAAEVSA